MKKLALLAVSAVLLLPAMAAAQTQDYKSVYDQIYAPPGGGAPPSQQQYQQQQYQQQKSTYDMIYDQINAPPADDISKYDTDQVPTLDVDSMNPSQPAPPSDYCGPPQCTVAPEDMNAQTPDDPCAPVLGMATNYDCLPPGSFERDLQRGR
jgi:hypothetical protein